MKARIFSPKHFRIIVILALGIAGLGVIQVTASPASPLPADPISGEPAPVQQGGDEYCLSCHEIPDLAVNTDSGEHLSLFVDSERFNASFHAEMGISCTQCHASISEFPHAEVDLSSDRAFTIEQNQLCANCHEDIYSDTLEGQHHFAIEQGDLEAAVCSDCHGSHYLERSEDPRGDIAATCSNCHSSIYDLYAESVHGSALLNERNPDVPTCVDCHGAHSNQGPSQGQFHLFSPQICASCHTNPELVEKYDLNPNVLDTYVADFHGTTVTLFEQITPDQETNKPVCVDCHSVHDIRSVDDPESRVIQANLLATCQRCHPDASEDFPQAWLSHYTPSWERTPLVTVVNGFYLIFIPTVVIGMLVMVIPDGIRRLRKRDGSK